MNKNINVISLMFFLSLHLSIQSSNGILLPYENDIMIKNPAMIAKNKMILNAIQGDQNNAETLYDEEKKYADAHFGLFLQNDTSRDHLTAYQEFFFNQCIVAVCGGRSDLLVAMPKKPWSSKYISPIFKSSKNKMYLSDIIDTQINNTKTGDCLLHLAVRAAAYHQENMSLNFYEEQRNLSKNQYPKIKKVIQFLINNNAHVNVQNNNGDTPLHIACKGDDLKTVTMLLKAGANPDITNKHGNNPEKYIANHSNKKNYETIFQEAREKNLWVKKLTKKESKAMAAEQAELNTAAQTQLKEKASASTMEETLENTTSSKIVPEDRDEFFEKIIYIGNIADPDAHKTPNTKNSNSSKGQAKNNFDSFKGKGDTRPGHVETLGTPPIQSSISPKMKSQQRATTAGQSRRKVSPVDSNPLTINNRTEYSTNKTTTTVVEKPPRPSTANNKNKSAPSSPIPDRVLAAQNAVHGYSSTTSSHTELLSKSTTEIRVL